MSKKRTQILDPILNLRIADQERRGLFKEAERTSEARRIAPMNSRSAFPYDVWLARLGDMLVRLGMKLKTRPATEGYGPGLNIG